MSLDNAGLVGAIVVGAVGKMDANGALQDVTRDYVVSVSIIDENKSPFVERNVLRFLGSPAAVDIFDDGFKEANLKHSFNGFLFCNLRLTAAVGERVRLHLFSVGTALDMHSVTIRDNTLLYGATPVRQFAADSYAGATNVVDVTPQAKGSFVVQCDVHDHHDAGMLATLAVF
jgi:hephaestin